LSVDSDGSVVSWSWSFGDGGSSSVRNPVHVFDAQNTYSVTLTVLDNGGLIDSETKTVTVSSQEGPTVDIIYPKGGETLTGSVTVQWVAQDNNHENDPLSITIKYRSIDDTTWVTVLESVNNDGQFLWDTTPFDDGGYFLRIEAMDQYSNTANDTSNSFTIRNNYQGVQIIDIEVIDLSIESNEWVKNGDALEISAELTGSEHLNRNDVWADLTGLGWGKQVLPDEFDGSVAIWTLPYVDCSPEDGSIIITINATQAQSKTTTIMADNTDPLLSIEKPLERLYLFNGRPLPLLWPRTIIVGPIEVSVQAYDESSIQKVEYYIDNELEYTTTTSPYQWYMKLKIRGSHRLQVLVYDSAGNTAMEKIVFMKLL